MSENNKTERTKTMVDAIRMIKNSQYCGSEQAYTYLKAKEKYFDIAHEIGKNVRVEFPGAKLPMPSEVEDIERRLTSFLYDFFGAKHGEDYSSAVEADKNSWRSKNFSEFALEYCRSIAACEDPMQFTKETVFVQTCERFFGELDPPLKEFATDAAEGLGTYLDKYEANRLHERFNFWTIYDRLANDRILNRDEYQREFIMSYLDCRWSTYLDYASEGGDGIAAVFDAKAPQTFEELVMFEKRRLEMSKKEYHNAPSARAKRDVDVFEYLIRTLSRHRSFVEKMLKERNNQKDDTT
jgi:hypothetical protein